MRGETVLLNAASHFSESVLAVFFPRQNGGAAGALFSDENLNNSFDFGVNQSYLINADGDVLAHAGFTPIRGGKNPADSDFIQSVLESPERAKQQLVEFDLTVKKDTDAKDFFGLTLEKILSFFYKYRESKYNNVEKTRMLAAYTKLNTAGVTVITCVEYDKIFEGINAVTRRNIYFTVAILILSVILIKFFSKSICGHLEMFTFSMRQIERGNFILIPKSKRRDEIGALTSGFRRMCAALNIFGKFTNKEIAVKIMKGEIKPEGFQKHATVFFSNIRDFNVKSENFKKIFDAEASRRIVQWLNRYFTSMIECVKRTNGVLDKFIGDAVMAHWGAVYTAGNPRKDAFNCIKTALMMRQKLYFINKARKPDDKSDPVIHIGCGINTGIVTAGQVGSDMRAEYTIIGDSVNLASLIQTLTVPMGADILISENTWQLVWDMFITEEMPSIIVKGNEKPLRIFAVINLRESGKGPKNMYEVRKLLGIKHYDISKADFNEDRNNFKMAE